MNLKAKHPVSLLVILPCILLSGCTAQSWYQAAQENRKQACIKEPPGQYQECLDQFSQSYEEYEAKRKEALKDEPPAN